MEREKLNGNLHIIGSDTPASAKELLQMLIEFHARHIAFLTVARKYIKDLRMMMEFDVQIQNTTQLTFKLQELYKTL